jgi:hypothetical protein
LKIQSLRGLCLVSIGLAFKGKPNHILTELISGSTPESLVRRGYLVASQQLFFKRAWVEISMSWPDSRTRQLG